MTCFSGGTLEIYIEPQQPRPRLLIIGTLPVAQALAYLGRAMNYHVIAVDPNGNGVGMEHADELITDLTQLSSYVTPLTYVVVATHGNYDELALVHILKSNAPYVGMVASKRRAESVRTYLLAEGLTEGDLYALKAPAGLDIQARRGDEIALSIMAEIVQQRRNSEQLDWALFHHDVEEDEVESASCCGDSVSAGTPLVAIDPICQMEVTIATAMHKSEIDGEMVYFCCAGCQQRYDLQLA
ncbi:MAG: XdhC family protein [Chloroflexota bacterium]